MTLQTIESKDLTVGELFNDFYVVPSYQREYVWEKKQVEQLLEDVLAEYSSNSKGSEYFLGSIVVCAGNDGVYDLIDGQQRMTTSYLLLCGLRDHLKEFDPKAPMETLKKHIAACDVGGDGEDIFRYRVSLQYEDSCNVLETIAGERASITDITAETRSVQNIVAAYETMRSFLREKFGDDFSAAKRFYAFFTKNVKLIRVKTASIAHALRVFETINDRGLSLDAMDLLKNLMFMNASASDFDKLKDKWKELVDILHRADEKPLRFLRYYIFADHAVERLREEETYDWFVANEKACGYKSNPLTFVDTLIEAASAYVKFLEGLDVAGRENRYLSNISHMSGAARQHLILLLAGRHLKGDSFNSLCRQVENLFFAYVICRENTREFERLFAEWAVVVRRARNTADIEAFVQDRIVPEKKKLATRFVSSFRELNESSLQKYRMRYVLAKLVQYVNESAWGSTGAHVDLRTYLNKSIEIEHVLPQVPSEAIVKAFDEEPSIYIHRLGNLTLVEKSINCSIGNGTFEEKKNAYSQSNFLLTKSLAGKVTLGKETLVDRAVRELGIFDTWNSKDIERRQEMLAQLALKAWDMPTPDDRIRTVATAGS